MINYYFSKGFSFFLVNLILILILCGAVLAECGVDEVCDDYSYSDDSYDYSSESTDYDYYDFESYTGADASDFYANSDPLEWDLDQVDFSNAEVWNNPNIDQMFSREDSHLLYENEEFYANFDQAVEHYDKIDWAEFNFASDSFSFDSVQWSGVEGESEFQDAIANNQNGALDKYKDTYLPGQTLNLAQLSSSKGKLVFGEGQLSSTYTSSRGVVSTKGFVNFEDHLGAKFSVMEDGEIRVIYVGDNSVDSSTFDKDTQVDFFFVAGEGQTNTIGTGDNNIPVDGHMEYLDGSWYVPSGDSATVNGMFLDNTGNDIVKIVGIGSTSDDGQSLHLDTYSDLSNGETVVYVGENTFAVTRGCADCETGNLRNPSLVVTATTENTYGIPVEKKNDNYFYAQEYDDYLTIAVQDGTFVWNKEDANAEVYGAVDFENGHREVHVDGAVYSKAIAYEKTSKGSVAFEVEIFDIFGKDPYVELNDPSFTNTFSFGENQQITFGNEDATQKVAHFSVTIDPYEVFGDYTSGDRTYVSARDAVSVINELDGTNFYRPYFVITTPENNPEMLDSYSVSAQIIEDGLPKGYEPMYLQLEASYSDSSQSGVNKEFFKQLDNQADLENIDSTILGHSYYYEYVPTSMAAGAQVVGVIPGLQIDASQGTDSLTSTQLRGLSQILGRTVSSGDELSSDDKFTLDTYNDNQIYDFKTVVSGSSGTRNDRLDDALGCNEAIEKYNQLRLTTIAQGINNGIITMGTKEQFKAGEVDFYEEAVGGGLVINALNIRDPVAQETMNTMLAEEIDEVDEYYLGLDIGSSATLKRDSSEHSGITSESLPYFAAMRVMQIKYEDELNALETEKGRSLNEPELLAFGLDKGFDYHCTELPGSDFKKIVC